MTDHHGAATLSDAEREMLALERQWFRHAGSKETVIRDLFGWTPTDYYRRLNLLIDRPEAFEAESTVVTRLRRLREQRLARRGRLRARG